MEKSNKPSARRAAFTSLLRCARDEKYSNLEIDSVINKSGLEGAEKGLYTTLVYGVIERQITLDYIISRLSDKPLKTLDPEIITLLRLGLYQLIYLDRIPESAAVNESVELAKSVKRPAAPFVNALLRSFLRTMGKRNIPYPDKNDRLKYLSVRYSCSEDVIRILESSFSGDIEQLLLAFENQPETTLRVNTLKISRDELLKLLQQNNIEAYPTKYSPFGVKLCGHSVPLKISELISSGHVYIQDEASQIAVLAADPKPGTNLIDTCACPGGKSFSAAILMENSGKVFSFDLHKNKLSLIESGAKRLGITSIIAAEKNGAVYDDALCETADTVICDVPCSGLGVIAKKPDLRYKRLTDIERLPDIQFSIISNSAKYVKPDAKLLYTTCTLNKAENEAVVERFLAENTEFEPCEFSVGGLYSMRGMLTLYPHINNTDGFFISLLRRKISGEVKKIL
jgi:16S rRNA (cytosine967-C5)-methyltransferase